MHFWIDKRSPYGFGRGARVSGSGFAQYPRRLRPSKPWSSQGNRNPSSTTPTGAYPSHAADPQGHQHSSPLSTTHSDGLDMVGSPSYFKWTLWAIAIALSSLLIYILCAKLYHDHQIFTFCVLLVVFFILGVCAVSNTLRRTSPPSAAPPPLPGASSSSSSGHVMPRQESSSSASGRAAVTATGDRLEDHQTMAMTTTAGGPGAAPRSNHHNHHHHHHNHHHNNNNNHNHNPQQQQQQRQNMAGQMHFHQHHHHHNHHHQPPVNSSPPISIHNLAESPTPQYHNSHNQYSPPPYHIALEMHNPEEYVKTCDEVSLPSYDKVQQQPE